MKLDGDLLRGLHTRVRRHRVPARGFSLIELLLVMVILIVLFTLYFGGGSRNFQMKQIANCNKNLQNIYVTLKTYSLDHDGKLPSLPGATTSEPVLSLLVPRATTRTEYFICPGTDDKPLPDAESFADRRISYAYYMGCTVNDGATQPLVSDRQVNTSPKTPGQSLFSLDGKPPGANHNKYGGNILFCDGSIETSGAYSAFNLTNAPNVVLLNPKP